MQLESNNKHINRFWKCKSCGSESVERLHKLRITEYGAHVMRTSAVVCRKCGKVITRADIKEIQQEIHEAYRRYRTPESVKGVDTCSDNGISLKDLQAMAKGGDARKK